MRGLAYTPAEDALVMACRYWGDMARAARKLGRSQNALYVRRARLRQAAGYVHTAFVEPPPYVFDRPRHVFLEDDGVLFAERMERIRKEAPPL